MAIDGRLSPMEAGGYVISQVIGAIGASALILVLWSKAAVAGTITAPGSGFNDVQALVFETVLTAIFLLVILASTKHAPALAPLAIPLTLVAIHLVAVPFTGSSVNPARSIAPALLGGDLSKLWIYLVGPVVGAVIAALVYRTMERMPTAPARP